MREYEEETNLRAMLLVIPAEAWVCRRKRPNKATACAQVGRVLAHIIMRQSDSIGLMTFDTDIRTHIPPRSSNRHLRVLYEEMLPLSRAVRRISPRFSRHCAASAKAGDDFHLSDCFTDVKELLKSLAHFGMPRMRW